MIPLATIPFLLGVALFLLTPRIGRSLPPALATFVLTGLALTVSLTAGLALSAVAVVSLAQLPVAGQLGHWSAATIGSDSGLPLWVGATTAFIVVGLLSAAVFRALRAIRAIVLAGRAVRGLEIPASNLVVLEHEFPTAYAVGGRHGRVVVSTSMLKALPADERRVLLAHEAAHVRHHHYLFVQLCEVAAAANPLVRRTVAAVRTSVERWADESAAGDVGDRALAARSLARASLARAGSRSLAGTLGASDGDVVVRVRALLAEPPNHRWRLTAVLFLGATACWLTAALMTVRAHDLIELAEGVYHR